MGLQHSTGSIYLVDLLRVVRFLEHAHDTVLATAKKAFGKGDDAVNSLAVRWRVLQDLLPVVVLE